MSTPHHGTCECCKNTWIPADWDPALCSSCAEYVQDAVSWALQVDAAFVSQKIVPLYPGTGEGGIANVEFPPSRWDLN